MFSSSKISDSPRILKDKLQNSTINESSNGIVRSFIQPKITSTPMRRDTIFATPPKPSILSPRRYSLSDVATPPRTNRKELSKILPSGPLLASTKYNINVSTYEDTKSPGLAGRIVQYNEEAEREREQQRHPTHQTKYGSPGLFPVVHLFKKKLPTLDHKPRRLSIRIASPEYTRQHTPEYNRRLLEGIVKSGSSSINGRIAMHASAEPRTSTRSVLDALKEISRKRIHASEEYDLNEDNGKRIRTEHINGTESSKRGRDESPLLDTSLSPSKPVSKRICMYDEYAASCSSMDFSLKKTGLPKKTGSKRKSISISTSTENSRESKQVKLVNAETQTVVAEPETSLRSKDKMVIAEISVNNKEINETNKDEAAKKKDSPVKIFDDAPLERIRKNRLAALMGSLTGKEPVLTPKPDYAASLGTTADSAKPNQVSDSKTNVDSRQPEEDASKTVGSVLQPVGDASKPFENPLISILVSPKKVSPVKSTKHVHFSIPESTSQTSVTGFSLTQSTPSITSPISSTSEAKVSFGPSKNTAKETPAPPSSPVGLHPSSNEVTAPSAPLISFGTGSSSSSQTSVISRESSSTLLVTETYKNDGFQFKPPSSSGGVKTTTSATSLTKSQMSFGSNASIPASSVSSPPKMGGFKFDLTKPAPGVTTTTAFNIPSFNFTPQSDSTKAKSPFVITSSLPVSATSSSLVPASGSFSFGSKIPDVSSSSAMSNTSNSVTTAPSATAPPIFSFGSGNALGKPATTTFSFLTSTSSVASTTSSLPAYGSTTNSSAPAFGSSIPSTGTGFDASKAPIFSFGSSTAAASNISSFGTPATTAAALTFGAPSASSGFNAPTTTSGFGAPKTNFGITTTSSTISFFGTPTTSSNFGSSSTAPIFGGSKPFAVTTSTTPAFGTSTTSSPFGKTGIPFGQSTTQSPFGAPATTSSFVTTNVFGGTTTTSTTSVFGGSNVPALAFAPKTGFGTSSSSGNVFGGAANTQASGFGTSNTKPFTATALPFGNTPVTTTSSAFGGATAPTFNFGAKTTASSTFGGVNAFGTTTTTASSNFGTPTTSAFGNSNTFGSSSTNFGTSNVFGASNTPAFIAPTTTQTGAFGTTSTSSFGTANSSFGSGSTGSVFGNSAPAFGTNSTPSFGSSAPASSFGTTNNTSGFGTNTGVSAFAKPQPVQTNFTTNAFGPGGFGAAQQQPSGFGANPTTTPSAVFNFGSGAAKPAGVFSFGAAPATEPPKPTFNFTAGNNSVPAFGSTATPNFGNTAPPAFGAVQFNATAQPTVPGTFSIGAGPAPGRARVQLKAKRRT